MKRRGSLIYLLVLVILAGGWYWFDVVKKEKKETAEREAKRVFAVKSDDIGEIRISGKDKPPVLMKKDGEWRILEPIQADVDHTAVQGFLRSVANLETQRDIADKVEDLKPFGLDEPALTIRFRIGDTEKELLLGGNNPTGDARYAKLGDKPAVFLVGEGNWSALNKGVNELRRRELFTFKMEDVTGVTIVRDGAGEFGVVRGEDGKTWKDATQPDIRIKPRKVENFIEQLHWLRAQNFYPDAASDLASSGLEPAPVTVRFRFAGGKSAELKIGPRLHDEKITVASSSQLPGVVQVASGVLQEIPVDIAGFEDRSLIGFPTQAVKQVKWAVGNAVGHAVEMDGDKWGMKSDEASAPKEFKDSWRVKSILWDISDAERREKIDPAPPLPEKPTARLELMDKEKNLATLTFLKMGEGKEAGNVEVWIETSGTVEAGRMDAAAFSTLNQDLDFLAKSLTQPVEDGNKAK